MDTNEKPLFELKTCQVCGAERSAIWRFWSKKNECNTCAHKSFKVWYAVAFGTVAVFLISLFF